MVRWMWYYVAWMLCRGCYAVLAFYGGRSAVFLVVRIASLAQVAIMSFATGEMSANPSQLTRSVLQPQTRQLQITVEGLSSRTIAASQAS
ncbi:hypothetical protein EJ03DRAFT_139137 [Teratosphaeria nubilosa]|uniref:Uncharacterized protein n=1 Tax=Teratosphaeria nubilosa TaxID=161662 RepID=A0A6G1L4N1_9PEZI|nr:hypothetical protein EJ03DRAFT_139137 [Teratosphaeria nubilosa]